MSKNIQILKAEDTAELESIQNAFHAWNERNSTSYRFAGHAIYHSLTANMKGGNPVLFAKLNLPEDGIMSADWTEDLLEQELAVPYGSVIYFTLKTEKDEFERIGILVTTRAGNAIILTHTSFNTVATSEGNRDLYGSGLMDYEATARAIILTRGLEAYAHLVAKSIKDADQAEADEEAGVMVVDTSQL
jgi:hypothetical protein